MRFDLPCHLLIFAKHARLVFLVVAGLSGTTIASEWRRPVLEVFVQGDAERSVKVRDFVEKAYSQRAGLAIVYHDVMTSEKGRARFRRLVDHFKVPNAQFPAFYVSGQFESGWTATTPGRLEELLSVEVFTRQSCPRCAEAKLLLFQTLAHRYPAYRFIEQDLEITANARQRLSELSLRYHAQATSVPAVHMCGRLLVGFIDANTTLRQWDGILRAVTIAGPEGKIAPQPFAVQTAPRTPRLGGRHWFHSVVDAAEPPRNPSGELADVPPTPDQTAEHESENPSHRGFSAESPDDLALPSIPETDEVALSEIVEIPLLGSVRWRDWGFPAFTIVVGLIDGFNPCAIWVLLFLLSMLVNLQDRGKILAVAGTFVFVSGAAYYAFMTAWLSIFELIGFMRPAQILLGLIGISVGAIHVKDFFAFKKGVSLSIPESAKPGIYARVRAILLAKSLWSAIAGASVVAVLVNMVELLCTAGLPAMYTSILSSQQWPWWKDHLYMLLYIVAYMFDDTLMVIGVVVTMNKFKLQERGGRILKLISGLAIISLSLVMLLKPQWLS